MTVGELRKALEGVADDKTVLFVNKDFYAEECGSIDPEYDGGCVVIWSGELNTGGILSQPVWTKYNLSRAHSK